MATPQQIEMTKVIARKANELGDDALVALCIEWLDANWHDYRAAHAFYTELELTALGNHALDVMHDARVA